METNVQKKHGSKPAYSKRLPSNCTQAQLDYMKLALRRVDEICKEQSGKRKALSVASRA